MFSASPAIFPHVLGVQSTLDVVFFGIKSTIEPTWGPFY